MGQFVFSNNTIELDIAGEIFSVEPTLAVANVKNTAKRVVEQAAAFEGKDDTLEAIESICVAITGAVDEILGKGSCERIFKDRTVTFYDCMDLYKFVTEEINTYVAQKNAAYKSTVNRAQRRSKGK